MFEQSSITYYMCDAKSVLPNQFRDLNIDQLYFSIFFKLQNKLTNLVIIIVIRRFCFTVIVINDFHTLPLLTKPKQYRITDSGYISNTEFFFH